MKGRHCRQTKGRTTKVEHTNTKSRMTKGKIFQFCINCVEGTVCVPACSY